MDTPQVNASVPVQGGGRKSYSSVTSTITNYPSRDQAIVFKAIDDVTVKDYIIEMAKLTEPKNILFVSKISHGRICFYLSSRVLADEFVANFKEVKIKNNIVPVRKLITATKRVILSNVHPCIPNTKIEEELQKLGFTTTSAISFMGAGFSDVPALAHIKSFRRQVYVQVEEDHQLPSSIDIAFDNEKFKIFMASEVTCFICKEEGHIAGNCPKSTTAPESKIPKQKSGQEGPMEVITETNNNENVGTSHNTDTTPQPQQKIITEDNQNSFVHPSSSIKNRHKAKTKRKRIELQSQSSTESEDDAASYNEFAGIFDNHSELSFNKFCDFLNEVKNQDNALNIAMKFTNKTDKLIQLLIEANNNCSNKRLKARIKRLIKKLHNSVDDSDQSSQEGSIDMRH